MRWHLTASLTTIVLLFSIWSNLLADQSSKNMHELEAGNYLSDRYIKILEKTHSPLTAEEGALKLVVVKKLNNFAEILPIMNFHEGGPSFRVEHSGAVTLNNAAGLDIKHYTVRINKYDELTLGFNDFSPEKFILTKDLQDFIRRKSVAGSYIDNEGRSYKFEPNGIAITPTSTFRYTVGVDHIPYHFDYIEDSDTHQIYRFVRKKCHLEIYKVLDAVENQHGNDGRNVTIFASLDKVGCKD